MNNEDKMLQILTQMQSNIENLTTDMQDVKQKVTKIEVTLENETNRNIRLLAEGHEMMVEKLDKLGDMGEQILELKTDASILKTATGEFAKKAK